MRIRARCNCNCSSVGTITTEDRVAGGSEERQAAVPDVVRRQSVRRENVVFGDILPHCGWLFCLLMYLLHKC